MEGSSSNTQRMFDAVERLRIITEPLKGEMDRARKLPRQVVEFMREEKLLSFWLPPEYGGPDLNMPNQSKSSKRWLTRTARSDGVPAQRRLTID